MPTTSTNPRAAAAALLVPGTTCHGFAVERCETVPELDSDAYVLRHTASGARLLYLACDDENKAFAIGFKTPPADSTGVFHILEHSVLCGSAKFPVKEPFVDLIKSSMQTFLNGQGGLAHTDRAAVLGHPVAGLLVDHADHHRPNTCSSPCASTTTAKAASSHCIR